MQNRGIAENMNESYLLKVCTATAYLLGDVSLDEFWGRRKRFSAPSNHIPHKTLQNSKPLSDFNKVTKSF